MVGVMKAKPRLSYATLASTLVGIVLISGCVREGAALVYQTKPSSEEHIPPASAVKKESEAGMSGRDTFDKMKAYALGRRATLNDYVDLYFVLKEKAGSLEQIIASGERKYGREFDPRLFLEQLIYLKDVEKIEIRFLKERLTIMTSLWPKEPEI